LHPPISIEWWKQLLSKRMGLLIPATWAWDWNSCYFRQMARLCQFD
jgi:hypothetical protein